MEHIGLAIFLGLAFWLMLSVLWELKRALQCRNKVIWWEWPLSAPVVFVSWVFVKLYSKFS